MNSYIKNIMTIFSLCFLISCTDNLNFDEINLNVEPVLTVPLIYFDLDQNDFFDYTSDSEIPLITDTSDFRVFKSSAIRNDVFKIVFDFEIENRFDRSFEINIVFYDGNDNITRTIPSFNIGAQDLNFVASDSIDIAASPVFLTSRKVKVELKLNPSSTQIDPNIYQLIKFKSIGTFHLSI